VTVTLAGQFVRSSRNRSPPQVWLAAAVPDVSRGRSFIDEVRADPGAITNTEWLGQNPVGDRVLATYFLFHDCDLATVQWALTTLRLFAPQAVYHEVPGLDSWPPLPSTYILPSDDRTLLPAPQRGSR